MIKNFGKSAAPVQEKSEEVHIQTLEEIRDMLLKETPKQGESADKRSGFVNGILDMYNCVKNRQDKLLAIK
jgi:hypothetical protein